MLVEDPERSSHRKRSVPPLLGGFDFRSGGGAAFIRDLGEINTMACEKHHASDGRGFEPEATAL